MHNSNPPALGPLVVDEREAARLLGISPRSMWQLNADGEVRAIRVGRGAKRYAVSELERYITDKMKGGEAQ